MNKLFCFFLAITLLPLLANSQTWIEIKGVVVSSESNVPLASVDIFDHKTGKKGCTDKNGEFHLLVQEESVLIFSLQGYKTLDINISKDLREFRIVKLARKNIDSLNLSKPNVVFILADDLGWSQISAYNGSNSYYKTPHIDRISNEGIQFTNAYASAPVCSPTRASIMTGKYPARLGLTTFIPGNQTEERILTAPSNQQYLPLGEETLGNLFQGQGYQTAYLGKWHLSKMKSPPESIPHNPDKQGFEKVFITYKPNSRTNPEDDPHNTTKLVDTAINYLNTLNDNQPFFMYLSFNAIHDPLKEKADSIFYWQNKEESRKKENNPIIGTMIQRMDNNIGRLLDYLDKKGLKENTIVVFYSDHGGLDYHASQFPLRGGKGWLYEGGIRVPLIIRWPGVVIANSKSEALVSSIDFFPTFSEVLKLELPKNIDGISILHHLKTGKSLPNRNLYWHFPHYHGIEAVPSGAIINGKWKLIEWFEESLTHANSTTGYELYNLERDIGETVNLVNEFPGIFRELQYALIKWRDEIGAKMPLVNEK